MPKKETKKPRHHMTGMHGVYLTAVELTKRGLVVSPTSRSAFGADLLVTDERCQRAWSVQVKTNNGRPNFWLLNKHADQVKSKSHVYVLVNLGQANEKQKLSPPDFFVVPSTVVAKQMRTVVQGAGSTWYSINTDKIGKYRDKWNYFGA